jgi:hypothetical protein
MNAKTFDKLVGLSKKLRHLCDGERAHLTFFIKNKRIVSFGANDNVKSHKICHRLGYYGGSRHSEIDAYIKLRDKSIIPSITVVNVRISKTGVIGMSKPCKRCMPFCSGLPFKHLYYTDPSGCLVKAW